MFTFATKPHHKAVLAGKTKKALTEKQGHSQKVRSVLQHIIGNQEITSLLEPKTLGRNPKKHTVNNPGDAYEREADRVADQVMRKPLFEPRARQPSPAGAEHEASDNIAIQTKAISNGSCASAANIDDDEQTGQMVQKKEQAGSHHDVTPQFSTPLKQGGSHGDKLPSRLRRDMEARFGHSFRQVRIHTDQQAVNMTQEVNAQAFATGNHIYLNAGRYNPESFSGKWLLAHELTHVLQQRKSPQKSVGTMAISNVDSGAVQRYKLKGFPAAKAAQMHTAIATAISTVSSCSYLNVLGKLLIKTALRRMRYDYVPDLGLCGWTFPASWYIEVGEQAFDHGRCCDLASTLAHEASHTEWYTEGRARKMECKCFGCSC